MDATCTGVEHDFQTGIDFAPPQSTRVAFILTDESGRVDRGGRALSETDCTNVLMKKKFEVVERAKLDSVVKEQLRRESGLMSEGDAVSAGKLANAQGILIVQVANLDFTNPDSNQGIFASVNGDLRVTARWIDLETGVVRWSVKGTKKVSGFFSDTLVGRATGLGKIDYRDELTKVVKCTLQCIPTAGETAKAAGG